MYGKDILCGISKVPFEIPHKIFYPYIERWRFYTILNISELLDLRAHKCFWNAPPGWFILLVLRVEYNRIKSLSSMWKDFNDMHHLSVKKLYNI